MKSALKILGGILLLSLLSTLANAVEVKKAELAFAYETMLPSTISNQHYRIQWASIGSEPADGYPVLYLLDGDTTFPIASIAAHSLMVNKIAQKNAPVLIVGIGYSQQDLLSRDKRAKDYTPMPREGSNVSFAQAHGGANQFYQFIQTELTPFLQQHVKLNIQQQAVFGHSFGGLWASYDLLRHASFQHYLISSPSLWWGEQRIFDFLEMAVDKQHKPSIRLTLGELEIVKNNDDIRRKRRDMKGNLEKLVTNLHQRGYVVQQDIYAGENHGSVQYRALLEGLKFLQEKWQRLE